MSVAPPRAVPLTTAPATPEPTPAAAKQRGSRTGRSRPGAWILRPLGLTIANLAAFVVLAFFLVQLIPGDPVVTATGGRLTGAELEAARAAYGLDRPWPEQFIAYLGQLLSLDLGTSIATGRPVADDFATRIPATLELVLSGLVLACVVAMLLSHYAVTHRATRAARVLTSYARSAGALPEYVIGIAFLFVFYAVLHWAPAPSGRLDPALISPPRTTGFPILDALLVGDLPAAQSGAEHLVLPVIVMVVAHTPILMKTLIVGLDTAIDDPATRFRIASGARRRTVLASIYRRALPTAVPMLGMLFGLLLGGAVVLEALFGLGGLGQYAVDAVNSSDVFALRSFLVVTAAMCLAIYLLSDVAVGLLDPRRRSVAIGGAR
ncbi:ABC transporter permease subunit [Rathayibacter sp. VKM Ac-2803]|uniref:ABC transporter permease n=1 Tax=unclassified Rathayibacter TaxID=2609250 RepID=UPI001358B91C|nr:MULTISPECIES: ABC transporter permease [unclassified Rathayibacter]MWV48759.1 ABC transporter permease subunit [Rathayibacter sp. VKM Ac-2803]MWV60367.1 ABC transporter permease subunit [Rathayibacter sp. VKM Ac-2754]